MRFGDLSDWGNDSLNFKLGHCPVTMWVGRKEKRTKAIKEVRDKRWTGLAK